MTPWAERRVGAVSAMAFERGGGPLLAVARRRGGGVTIHDVDHWITAQALHDGSARWNAALDARERREQERLLEQNPRDGDGDDDNDNDDGDGDDGGAAGDAEDAFGRTDIDNNTADNSGTNGSIRRGSVCAILPARRELPALPTQLCDLVPDTSPCAVLWHPAKRDTVISVGAEAFVMDLRRLGRASHETALGACEHAVDACDGGAADAGGARATAYVACSSGALLAIDTRGGATRTACIAPLVRRMEHQGDHASTIALGAAGQVLATGHVGTVCLWDVRKASHPFRRVRVAEQAETHVAGFVRSRTREVTVRPDWDAEGPAGGFIFHVPSEFGNIAGSGAVGTVSSVSGDPGWVAASMAAPPDAQRRMYAVSPWPLAADRASSSLFWAEGLGDEIIAAPLSSGWLRGGAQQRDGLCDRPPCCACGPAAAGRARGDNRERFSLAGRTPTALAAHPRLAAMFVGCTDGSVAVLAAGRPVV
jgi:hypothetical protein